VYVYVYNNPHLGRLKYVPVYMWIVYFHPASWDSRDSRATWATWASREAAAVVVLKHCTGLVWAGTYGTISYCYCDPRLGGVFVLIDPGGSIDRR
jgi:hypothetical protein